MKKRNDIRSVRKIKGSDAIGAFSVSARISANAMR